MLENCIVAKNYHQVDMQKYIWCENEDPKVSSTI